MKTTNLPVMIFLDFFQKLSVKQKVLLAIVPIVVWISCMHFIDLKTKLVGTWVNQGLEANYRTACGEEPAYQIHLVWKQGDSRKALFDFSITYLPSCAIDSSKVIVNLIPGEKAETCRNNWQSPSS